MNERRAVRQPSRRSPLWRASRGRVALLLALTITLVPGALTGAAVVMQRGFASPEDAVAALVAAVKANDKKALIDILGSEGRSLIDSGDAVADRNARQRFVAEYESAHRLAAGGGKVILHVGQDDYPFPIPLVPDGILWRFDTRAGKDEILTRRIGKNELNAIQTCLAYVDAQREYYSEDRNADGVREYATRFASTPGRHDGLFWKTKPGEQLSPLGPLVAAARGEGYRRGKAGSPVPYHGYFYRILTAQGPGATGGAYDYIAHGRMIGGFALVAFPAQYGVSGVMTFIVNHEGVVYEKDLGPDTTSIARGMKLFNPDSSWKKA
jgi:hypothetical protein